MFLQKKGRQTKFNSKRIGINRYEFHQNLSASLKSRFKKKTTVSRQKSQVSCFFLNGSSRP